MAGSSECSGFSGSGRCELLVDGDVRDVAVSIEPSTAGDRVSVLARACGLSPRETELLHHLAGGAGTRDIARQMFVSENTVQDHLKSIFDKSAARSRRALLARALGT